MASTHDDLLCFTDTGRVFKKKVYEIPEGTRTSRGRAIVNLINLVPGERVVEFMPIADFEKGEDFLLFATANGLVKRTALADYRNVNSSGLIALNLRDGDSLDGVNTSATRTTPCLDLHRHGHPFQRHDARAMGRNARASRASTSPMATRHRLLRVAPEGNPDADLLTVTERLR